jgi:hypothetical protein
MIVVIQDVITDLHANPMELREVPVEGALAHSGILSAAWNVAGIIHNKNILVEAFDRVESVGNNSLEFQ